MQERLVKCIYKPLVVRVKKIKNNSLKIGAEGTSSVSTKAILIIPFNCLLTAVLAILHSFPMLSFTTYGIMFAISINCGGLDNIFQDLWL